MMIDTPTCGAWPSNDNTSSNKVVAELLQEVVEKLSERT